MAARAHTKTISLLSMMLAIVWGAGVVANPSGVLYYKSGQGKTVEAKQSDTITMVSEKIVITASETELVDVAHDAWHYDCTYVLENTTGDEVAMTVGFPLTIKPVTQHAKNPHVPPDNPALASLLEELDKGDGKGGDGASAKDPSAPASLAGVLEYDFLVTIDGVAVPVQFDKDLQKSSTRLAKAAAVWEMTFAPGQTRTLSVGYDSSTTVFDVEWRYAGNVDIIDPPGPLNTIEVSYVLTTGSNWKGPIGEATFEIVTKDVFLPVEECEKPGECPSSLGCYVREGFCSYCTTDDQCKGGWSCHQGLCKKPPKNKKLLKNAEAKSWLSELESTYPGTPWPASDTSWASYPPTSVVLAEDGHRFGWTLEDLVPTKDLVVTYLSGAAMRSLVRQTILDDVLASKIGPASAKKHKLLQVFLATFGATSSDAGDQAWLDELPWYRPDPDFTVDDLKDSPFTNPWKYEMFLEYLADKAKKNGTPPPPSFETWYQAYEALEAKVSGD